MKCYIFGKDKNEKFKQGHVVTSNKCATTQILTTTAQKYSKVKQQNTYLNQLFPGLQPQMKEAHLLSQV